MHLPAAGRPPPRRRSPPQQPPLAPARSSAASPHKTRPARPRSAPPRTTFSQPPTLTPTLTYGQAPSTATTNPDDPNHHPPTTITQATAVMPAAAAAAAAASWTHLPLDIRLLVQARLDLRDAFALAEAAPHPAQQAQLRRRVADLQHLRACWVDAAQPALRSYANPAHLSTRAARAAVSPTQFVCLSTLPLAASGLRSLAGVCELRGLLVLDASRNGLTDVDVGLAACTGLRVLHLGWNALSSFPDVVMRLRQLRTLLLHHNRIERLPEVWDRLPHLYRLGLFDCGIRDPLPEQLCRMLGTQTEQRRCRSANLQRNLIDHAVMTQILAKFPKLASAIVF